MAGTNGSTGDNGNGSNGNGSNGTTLRQRTARIRGYRMLMRGRSVRVSGDRVVSRVFSDPATYFMLVVAGLFYLLSLIKINYDGRSELVLNLLFEFLGVQVESYKYASYILYVLLLAVSFMLTRHLPDLDIFPMFRPYIFALIVPLFLPCFSYYVYAIFAWALSINKSTNSLKLQKAVIIASLILFGIGYSITRTLVSPQVLKSIPATLPETPTGPGKNISTLHRAMLTAPAIHLLNLDLEFVPPTHH